MLHRLKPAIALLAICTLAAANRSDWDNLRQLKPGEKITVSSDGRTDVQGRFISFGGSALTIANGNAPTSMPRSEVVRVRRAPGHRAMWIGLGLGAGAGAAVGGGVAAATTNASGGDFANLSGVIVGVVAGIGALAGALIGSTVAHRHATVYER